MYTAAIGARCMHPGDVVLVCTGTQDCARGAGMHAPRGLWTVGPGPGPGLYPYTPTWSRATWSWSVQAQPLAATDGLTETRCDSRHARQPLAATDGLHRQGDSHGPGLCTGPGLCMCRRTCTHCPGPPTAKAALRLRGNTRKARRLSQCAADGDRNGDRAREPAPGARRRLSHCAAAAAAARRAQHATHSHLPARQPAQL